MLSSLRVVGAMAVSKRKSTGTAPDMFLKVLEKEFKGVEIVKEYIFHPVRKWRFDYAIPSRMVAIEVDGGVWVGGRHNRPSGYINDMEKLNNAASLGWLVLRIATGERFTNKTLELIGKTLQLRNKEI